MKLLKKVENELAVKGEEVVLQSFVDKAIAEAEKLRGSASEHEERIAAVGRKAMRELMQRVYVLYERVKSTDDNGDTNKEFIKKVEKKLDALKEPYKSTSPETSKLIRYIFKDFDDKKVSIYGKSLSDGRKAKVKPLEFAEWIEKTKGGFAGDKFPDKVAKEEANTGPQTALAHARTEKTLETLHDIDWKDNTEKFRILIAVRSDDDDTAEVKDSQLSPKAALDVIMRFDSERTQRNKPTIDQDVEADKDGLFELEVERGNAETKWQDYKQELVTANASGDSERMKKWRAKVRVAAEQFSAAELLVTRAKARIKKASEAMAA